MARIECEPFVRPAPRGQAPPSDWDHLEETVAFNLAWGMIDRPNYLFRRDYENPSPCRSGCELAVRTLIDATVGLQGAVMARGAGLVCPDLVYHPLNFTRPSLELDAAVNLKQYNDGAYYHFLVEVLPRLMAWEDDGVTPLLVGIGPALTYVYEYLELLGYARNRVLGVETARVRTLYWPTYSPWPTDEQGEFPREPLLELRRRLAPDRRKLRKFAVVVARPENNHREAANLAEVAARVAAAGYDVVASRPHLLPNAAAEIDLFRHATLLVGASAGALTNLLFMPDDSAVIEFHCGGIPPHRSIWHLAACLGHRYYSLFTGPDRTVDLAALDAVLEAERKA